MYASSSGQLAEFLAIAKKHKWKILLPAVFVFCLGVALAIIIPRKYHAEASFELRYVRMADNRKDPTSKQSVAPGPSPAPVPPASLALLLETDQQ